MSPTAVKQEPNQLPPEQQLAVQTLTLINLIRAARPADSSELDRKYSIAITKAEELYAHIYTYIVMGLSTKF